MGGFPSSDKRPKSARDSFKTDKTEDLAGNQDEPNKLTVAEARRMYTPESELEKRVVATLKKLNKEKLSKGQGNRSVMNRVLLNFPKMQSTFTDLLELYMETDTDNSGSLDIEEVHELMHKLNPGIDRETTLQIFLQSDVYTDGQINFKEFLTCLALGYLLDLIPDLVGTNEDKENESAAKQVPVLPRVESSTKPKENSASVGLLPAAIQGEVQAVKGTVKDILGERESENQKSSVDNTQVDVTNVSEDKEQNEENKSIDVQTENGEKTLEINSMAAETSTKSPAPCAEKKSDENFTTSDATNETTEQVKTDPSKEKSSDNNIFHDKRGVRRVFELATELYLAFDSSCAGTITFGEMESIINSTTGESEMTKKTQETRKRRNSLTSNASKQSGKRIVTSKPKGSSPMSDLLSRNRWKELDWDSDGFITYQEFIFTFVKWVASLSNDNRLDSDNEEDEG